MTEIAVSNGHCDIEFKAIKIIVMPANRFRIKEIYIKQWAWIRDEETYLRSRSAFRQIAELLHDPIFEFINPDGTEFSGIPENVYYSVFGGEDPDCQFFRRYLSSSSNDKSGNEEPKHICRDLRRVFYIWLIMTAHRELRLNSQTFQQ